MEVRAVAKNTGISVRKMRPLINMVRGKKVEEALTMLRFFFFQAEDGIRDHA